MVLAAVLAVGALLAVGDAGVLASFGVVEDSWQAELAAGLCLLVAVSFGWLASAALRADRDRE